MVYINRKDKRYIETVDEFKSVKEAKRMIKEYQMSDSSGYYYISQRCCKDWK